MEEVHLAGNVLGSLLLILDQSGKITALHKISLGLPSVLDL
jgi:hypothetical protein